MRFRSCCIPKYLSALLLIYTSTANSVAPLEENGTGVEKRCPVVCGYYGQLCCQEGQYCYTDSNDEAQCGGTPSTSGPITAGSSGGYWEYWTSTWVQTDLQTVTQVYSTYINPVPASTTYVAPASTVAPLDCNWQDGESACGNICCQSNQYCVVSGQCGTSGYSSYSYSAALRPTASTLVYVTQTIQPTTTVPFEVPVSTSTTVTITATDSGSSGLSAGAIAGIVIGVILGLLLLILLCLLLCFRAAWDALLAFFGFGASRRRRTEEVYEYHHHGSRAGTGRWYGDRPPPPPEKKSGLGWGGVGLGLGGLAVLLGLKRRHDRKRRDEKSEYTASTGYYSDYTSSSGSDDRRTRDTRNTRH